MLQVERNSMKEIDYHEIQLETRLISDYFLPTENRRDSVEYFVLCSIYYRYLAA